jgi:hypothetical protein
MRILIVISAALVAVALAAQVGDVCRQFPWNVEDCAGDCSLVCRNGFCVPNLVLVQPNNVKNMATADHCAAAPDLVVADTTCQDSSIECSDVAQTTNCCHGAPSCPGTATIWNFRKTDGCCTVYVNCTTFPQGYQLGPGEVPPPYWPTTRRIV